MAGGRFEYVIEITDGPQKGEQSTGQGVYTAFEPNKKLVLESVPSLFNFFLLLVLTFIFPAVHVNWSFIRCPFLHNADWERDIR